MKISVFEQAKRSGLIILIGAMVLFNSAPTGVAYAESSGNKLTPQISSAIKSTNYNDMTLRAALPKAKNVYDVIALAEHCSSPKNRLAVLVSGTGLAASVDDYVKLASACGNDKTSKDAILSVGISKARTVKDFNKLAEASASNGNEIRSLRDMFMAFHGKGGANEATYNEMISAYVKYNGMKLNSALGDYQPNNPVISKYSDSYNSKYEKLDSIILIGKCSRNIKSILSGNYNDMTLRAALPKAKNIYDVIALAQHCTAAKNRREIIAGGLGLAVSVDDYIKLASVLKNDKVTRDTILCAGVSKAKSVEDFNKLASASADKADEIRSLRDLFAAVHGKGGAAEKKFNEKVSAYVSDNLKNLYASSGDFRPQNNLISNTNSGRGSVITDNKPAAGATAGDKKKAYEDMTNAYSAYKSALESDSPDADKLLENYKTAVEVYNKVK